MSTQRLLSLDVMRGLTIAAMILVNTPGSWSYLYAPLGHAAWHGMTPTDLVFPFFLFMVGMSMVFGLKKMQEIPKPEFLFKTFKRGVLLFVIGFVIHAVPGIIAGLPSFDLSKVRIPGVLQRIGIAYVFAQIMVVYLRPKQILVSSIFLLIGYWGLLYLGSDPLTLEGNILRSVDVAVFGESHIWAMHGESGRVPFDPEGLLGSIPSIVTVLVGFWVGVLIRMKKSLSENLVSISVFGISLILAGVAWSYALPINKALWTPSYVLVTGGVGALLLVLLTWVVDVKGYKKWTSVFVVYGSNALFAYCLAELWAGALWTFIKFPNAKGEWVVAYLGVFDSLLKPNFDPYFGSLIFAVFHVVLFWLVLLPLYKRKIFIKI
jgi:predicted acyltransferase